jgi:hypothetical protein
MPRIVLFLLTLLPLLGAAGAGRLDASIGTRSITLRGVTRGGEAVVYAFQLKPLGFESHAARRVEVLGDADRDGEVVWAFDDDITQRTVFVGIDVTTAQYVVASPDGFGVSVQSPPPGSFSAEQFAHRRPDVDVLYVHPGRGMWFTPLHDGHATDADRRTDGRVTLALDRAEPLGDSRATGGPFEAGGVLVVIDHITMNVTAARITGADLAGDR